MKLLPNYIQGYHPSIENIYSKSFYQILCLFSIEYILGKINFKVLEQLVFYCLGPSNKDSNIQITYVFTLLF